MNTAIRGGSLEHELVTALPTIEIKRPRLINFILITIVVMSAFSIIYLKDLNRRLFIHYQTEQSAHDKLYQDWGKLLLEQSTWSTQARVQKIAQNRLNMDLPDPNKVVVLRINK